ncbi:hypothetical protein B0H34DRAFT_677977 [Crassisporium funariophilum]|nr:hypothetical protein B0H34DRAFT_677977 [Crassisporium funariophilum]
MQQRKQSRQEGEALQINGVGIKPAPPQQLSAAPRPAAPPGVTVHGPPTSVTSADHPQPPSCPENASAERIITPPAKYDRHCPIIIVILITSSQQLQPRSKQVRRGCRRTSEGTQDMTDNDDASFIWGNPNSRVPTQPRHGSVKAPGQDDYDRSTFSPLLHTRRQTECYWLILAHPIYDPDNIT